KPLLGRGDENKRMLGEGYLVLGGQPMGEAKKGEMTLRQQMVEALGLETASGPVKVRWDGKRQATAQGQMAFFIEFLSATGLFDQWVRDSPLNYKSPNGSTPLDIDGRWMLSMLSGQPRIDSVRSYRARMRIAPVLGMSR
ncbi:MAG: hypothetical protein ACXW6R_18765, partial [Candidatus Binatia bacterium]